MKKVYLAVALVCLSLGLSACVATTVGKCLLLDNTSTPCH
jgi:hypothetical protein